MFVINYYIIRFRFFEKKIFYLIKMPTTRKTSPKRKTTTRKTSPKRKTTTRKTSPKRKTTTRKTSPKRKTTTRKTSPKRKTTTRKTSPKRKTTTRKTSPKRRMNPEYFDSEEDLKRRINQDKMAVAKKKIEEAREVLARPHVPGFTLFWDKDKKKYIKIPHTDNTNI